MLPHVLLHHLLLLLRCRSGSSNHLHVHAGSADGRGADSSLRR
jgi:hypothetical protein